MSNIITEAMLVIIDFSKFGENLKMRLEFADFPKGQLISKGWYPEFFQKTNEKIRPTVL